MRAGRRYSLANPCDNDISAADHEIIRKAQNVPALRTQPFVTVGIVNLSAMLFVRRPVEFDNELHIDAHEIRDIGTDRHLPAKFCTDATIA